MKIIVISSYSVIREGIEAVLAKRNDIILQLACETIKEALLMIKGNMADVLLLDIHKDNTQELMLISDLRASGATIKYILLDFYGDNDVFVKSIKCGVEGYLLGKSSQEEILYAIDQVYRGRKYFDSYFVDLMINENSDLSNKIELLTIRERQILIGISEGLSNNKIANKFFITENTVKKHISHIFEKLNMSDRAEVSVYVKKYGVLNR